MKFLTSLLSHTGKQGASHTLNPNNPVIDNLANIQQGVYLQIVLNAFITRLFSWYFFL